MSANEIAQGKTWVENTLHSIATKFGVKIGKMEWRCARGIESLAYIIDGKLRIEKFSEENLEDCPNDKAVKKSLEDRLTIMIKSALTSSTKIGFNRT